MDLLDIICFNLCPLESIFGGYKFSITTREGKKREIRQGKIWNNKIFTRLAPSSLMSRNKLCRFLSSCVYSAWNTFLKELQEIYVWPSPVWHFSLVKFTSMVNKLPALPGCNVQNLCPCEGSSITLMAWCFIEPGKLRERGTQSRETCLFPDFPK